MTIYFLPPYTEPRLMVSENAVARNAVHIHLWLKFLAFSYVTVYRIICNKSFPTFNTLKSANRPSNFHEFSLLHLEV